MDLPTLARSLHVIAASLWVGGSVLMAFVLGPALKAMGPAAGGFVLTLMRRGGLSPYFMSLGGVALVLGFYVYWALDYHTMGFSTGAAALVNLGALAAILAYGHALFALMPNERRMKAIARAIAPGSPPAPDQIAKLQTMGEKQGKNSVVSAILASLAFLLMTFSRLA